MSLSIKKALFLFAVSLFGHFLFARQAVNLNADNFPVIQKLSSSDVVFRQYQEVVNYNEKNLAAEKKDDLIEEFYVYVPKRAKDKGEKSYADDLLSVAAACGLPYETIATLNSIPDQKTVLYGRKLILPSVKGIFIKDNPESSVEILISREMQSNVEKSNAVCYYLNDSKFYFLPGERFSTTARAFFLDTTIRMPLDNIRVTSAYGYRNSPVYNKWKFHKGVDFAAGEGTPVYACKSGSVAYCVRNDPTFGNYIILAHSGGMTSVYAHLSKIEVFKGEAVHSGKEIGLVGRTGAVTGPHLHFEIRQNGVATDPAGILEF